MWSDASARRTQSLRWAFAAMRGCQKDATKLTLHECSLGARDGPMAPFASEAIYNDEDVK